MQLHPYGIYSQRTVTLSLLLLSNFQTVNDSLLNMLVSLVCLWHSPVTGSQWIRQHEETQSRGGMLPSTSPLCDVIIIAGGPCYFRPFFLS